MRLIIIFTVLIFTGQASFAVDEKYLDTKSPLTQEGLAAYLSQVSEIVDDPESLKTFKPEKLNQFLGRLCGAYIKKQLSPQANAALIKNETIIVGSILKVLYSKIDQKIDVTKKIRLFYPAYKATVEKKDWSDESKRQQYYNSVVEQRRNDQKLLDQINARQQLENSLSQACYYLGKLYPEKASLPEERAILKRVGLSGEQIDQIFSSK